jgi:hypothetical protein
MQSMVLVALALTGVAFSESKEPLDPGAAAGAYLSYGAPLELSYILELPVDHGTPYRFVELDWNPKGHGGPYTA